MTQQFCSQVLCSRKLKAFIYTKACIEMFIAVLFIIVPKYKEPQCSPADEWINKSYIHTIEYYLAIKSNEVVTCYNIDEP